MICTSPPDLKMNVARKLQNQSEFQRQSADTSSSSEPAPPSWFVPGRNCWRVDRADSATFLIDGESYFRAFRAAALRARHSIFILGWDFDSRIRMLIDRESDGFPDRLGEFLHALLIERRQLHIYVLTWDFHMIYWNEREWWLPSKLAAHRRLHFYKDAAHPLGASHHQKVVVVDDALAFVGGLDFAQCRWDTSRHMAVHPERLLINDETPCRPFHDVQLMVGGPVASTLGELARNRWHAATGRTLRVMAHERPDDLWPSGVKPDLSDVPVAIARTAPDFGERACIYEVEALFLDSLNHARRYVYIETQYLTSRTIADCLAARLQDPKGPEIVMVLHPNSDGWLEQHTMDVLRGRVLERLRAADRFHRLNFNYPKVPDLRGRCISMHSKVCIVDDEFVRVGSANLSNRSMGFDTECDLAIEASGNPAVRRSIAAFRHALLGEHLDVSAEAVAREIEKDGSLIGAVERLRGGSRTLAYFDGTVSADVNEVVPDEAFIDPSRPYEMQFIPAERRKPALRQVITGSSGLLALILLAGLWHWTPLRDLLDVTSLVASLEAVANGPVALLLTVGGFLIGGLLVMPVMVLIAVTILAFGPWWGFWYALIGMTASALLTFGIGRVLGRRLMDHLSGSWVHRISRTLAKKGVLTVVTLRMLPVAPFSILNAVAGASHIRTRDFFVGTVVGELPGLIGLALFLDQVTETIRHPDPGSIVLLVVIAAGIVLTAWALGRWLSNRPEEHVSGNG
ncbi:MAG TPA: VTT domain-containing protein [Nitrospira sp.]|nr:VTT domain-containing protein [Nitrospira sp.]